MRIDITGGNKRQHKVIREMAPFIIRKLLPRQCKDIEISFIITHLEDCQAATQTHSDYVKSPRPKNFEIFLHNKLPMRAFRLSLCHECVHVMQYSKAILYDYENGLTRWKNKIFDEENESYWALEYEEVARGKEETLLMAWKSRKKRRQCLINKLRKEK